MSKGEGSAQEETKLFPAGFAWGTATAAYQVEGGNVNSTWWAWEQAGRVAAGHTAAVACDWWGGRAEEDFDRAAEGHQTMLRLGVEWARVEPEPGVFSRAALERYRAWMEALHRRGLEPMVTLHHFSEPLWFAEAGGWEAEGAPERFARFVEKVAGALGDRVRLWCTVNEPNTYAALGYASGDWPPGKTSVRAALRVNAALMQGHAAAYRVLRSHRPEARVGWALNLRGFQPADPRSPLDRWAADTLDRLYNRLWPEALRTGRMRSLLGSRAVPEVRGTLDWFGVNYYTRDLVAFDPRRPLELFARRFYAPQDQLSDEGFIAHAPEWLYRFLTWAAGYGRPVLVTENGVCDREDRLRPRYLVQHLEQVWRAIQDGCPVEAYLHWTLVDNFEWERGWRQRFGLWELDLKTQERRKRPSADLYAGICRENRLPANRYRVP